MHNKRTAKAAFFNVRALTFFLFCTAAGGLMLSGSLLAFFRPETSMKDSQRTLTFTQRVAYQRAIEEVYWRHRILPKERPDPTPPLERFMSDAQLAQTEHHC